MKNALLYLWQLPQNLLGLILLLFYEGADGNFNGVFVRKSKKMLGGISLGRYVIVSRWAGENTLKHEYGHTIQSKYLGWLYLIVIGLPSLVWAWMYGTVIPKTKNGYYRFCTEKWAEKLGGVKR